MRWLQWLAAIWGCVNLAPASAETLSLRLHEAIAIAMRDNITVQNAYLSRISDKFAYRVAHNEFEPQYSLGGSLGRDSIVSGSRRIDSDIAQASIGTSLKVASGGQFALTYTQDADFIDHQDDAHSGAVTISFTQPLLRGFGKRVATANLTQAGFRDLSSQLGLKSTLIGTVTSVIRQYRSYVLARNSLDIAKISLERAQDQLETNRELVAAGRMASVELVQSETAVANYKLTLRLAQNSVDTERLNLLLLLRLPEDLDIDPTEPIRVVASHPDLDQIVVTAEANQPDYLRAKLDLKSAELSRAVSLNNQRWDLNLESSYRLFGSGTNLSDVYSGIGQYDDGDYSVRLILSIPLDDYARRQDLVNAEVGWNQAQNTFITTQENLRLTLRKAQQDVESSWDNVGLAKTSLDLSQRQLDLETEKLRAGKSSSFQVVSYQNDLANAENQYVTAQISYLNVLSSLDQLLGITLDRWGLKMVAESDLMPDDIPHFQATGPERSRQEESR